MERRSRVKLAVSALVLAGVLTTASVMQRAHGDDVHSPQAGIVAGSRAVFGDVEQEHARSRSAEALSRPSPIEPPSAEAGPTDEKVPPDIAAFVEKWRRTLMTGELNAHVTCYAPRVKRFFRQRGVSRDFVRREKEQMMTRYPEVSKYDIRDLRVEDLKGKRAVVTFTKDWDARGDRRFAGSEKQRLTLQKFGNDWVIVGEEEVKVYWVKRG